jgi:hypothetical protein
LGKRQKHVKIADTKKMKAMSSVFGMFVSEERIACIFRIEE